MTAMPDDHSPPSQFNLRSLFAVVFCICLLLGLSLPAIPAAREAARRTHCAKHLMFFGLALHNYSDKYDQMLPLDYHDEPSGTPLLSWRVAILPFVEQSAVYELVDRDTAWDRQMNQSVYVGISWFQCPSDTSPQRLTDYPAITGPGTAFPGPMKAVRFSDIADGTSHTIVVGHLVKSDIVWMEPRDLNFDQMSFRLNDGTKQSLSSHHPGGVPLLRADGSVRFYANGISPECLRAWLTISGNEPQEMYELPR